MSRNSSPSRWKAPVSFCFSRAAAYSRWDLRSDTLILARASSISARMIFRRLIPFLRARAMKSARRLLRLWHAQVLRGQLLDVFQGGVVLPDVVLDVPPHLLGELVGPLGRHDDRHVDRLVDLLPVGPHARGGL